MPAETPGISVIIPCFNLGHFVGRAIESVMDQDVPSVDIIVVDDGSTDNSIAVIDGYAKYVELVTLHTNQGVSAARNKGAERAVGNWYLFLDADDFLNDGALAAFSETAGQGGGGVVLGNVWQLDTEKEEYSERNNRHAIGDPPHPAAVGFWRSAIPTPGAAVVHRSVHAAIGGFAKPWQPTEDRDYWLKCGVTTSFRHCDFHVITKLMRPDSVRIYSDWAILWGMKVQFEFLEWCEIRGIDTGFLEVSSREIVDRAIKRATEKGEGVVLDEIMKYGRSRGISTGRLRRQKIFGYARRLLNRLG